MILDVKQPLFSKPLVAQIRRAVLLEAANICEHQNAGLVPPDGGSPTPREMLQNAAAEIRELADVAFDERNNRTWDALEASKKRIEALEKALKLAESHSENKAFTQVFLAALRYDADDNNDRKSCQAVLAFAASFQARVIFNEADLKAEEEDA